MLRVKRVKKDWKKEKEIHYLTVQKTVIFIYKYKVMDKKYYTYILLTEQNTLYCGYTDDVEKRFQAHLEGKGAKYTKSHKPVKIVYKQEFNTKSDAMKEEFRIKHLSRKAKLELIENY